VVAVQYTFTHKQYTQHNETEHTEGNIHNNKNTTYITIRIIIMSGPVFAHGTTGAKRTVGVPPPLPYIKICKKKLRSCAIL
jgi:hypothetical protein